MAQGKNEKRNISKHIWYCVSDQDPFELYTRPILVRVPCLRNGRALKHRCGHDGSRPGKNHGAENKAGDSHAMIIESAGVHEEEGDLGRQESDDVDAFECKEGLLQSDMNIRAGH